MNIEPANFEAADFLALIKTYLSFASQDACTHAIGISELQAANIRMFTARDEEGVLMGCAGLKDIGAQTGEIKSVCTHADHLRKGVSSALMRHIEQTAKSIGMTKLLLETHNTPPYAAACRLYEGLGYAYCGPFGDYVQNPRNVFMEKSI